jgi:glyoxylase-like metal-dependent hydrolase (beta-lactamase superfamily II)/rhodanese-related sulfurtransferase
LTIETPSLGDRSYVAHDGEVAVVVDPQRDIDRVLGVVATEGVRVTHVFETHIHNDYVTGGLALARATGAAYVVAAEDKVAYGRTEARDGSRFAAGRLTVTAMATPGHTPSHLSYRLSEGGGGMPVAVFTGGSMLFGAVGRTDLMGGARTVELTRAQFRSVRRLAADLPPDTEVYPTHGFGSFCAATQTSGQRSTIGHQAGANVALAIDDEELFLATLMAGLGAYPRYYAHMAPANLAGPPAPDLSTPGLLGPVALRRRIDAGEWVVDLRQRRAFARSHITGSVSAELGDQFATHLGWAIRWGTPVSLLGESASEVARAQRDLVRIGIDRLGGAAVGAIGGLADGRTSSYPVATFQDLRAASARDDIVILDVRRPDEWEAGHLAGAVHIPFWELEDRIDEVPPGEVWVHCKSGFRSAISASLLDRAGRRAVHVDDEWDAAPRLGLRIST